MIVKTKYIVEKKVDTIKDGQLAHSWHRVGAGLPEIEDGRLLEEWETEQQARLVLKKCVDAYVGAREYRIIEIQHKQVINYEVN